MSLVLQYKFDQTDVTLDSSGNSLHATNLGSTSIVDATYGNVALFSETTNMSLNNPPSVMTGTLPRTFSVWINRTSNGSTDIIYDSGTNTSTRILLFFQGTVLKVSGGGNTQDVGGVYDLETWYNIVLTFDGTSIIIYQNGASIYTGNHALNTTGPLHISRSAGTSTSLGFEGKMSDFRLYDYALNSSEVSTLYSNGPEVGSLLTIVPRSTNMPVTFEAVTGSLGYNVTIEGPTGGEITVLSGVTELEHNITGLVPETEYTVKLYADTGAGYELVAEEVITTLTNVAANYDVTDFISDGVVDLKSLPDSTIANITEVMNEVFTTGDLISISVTNKRTSFVKLGEKLNISNLNGVLLPFIENTIAGQTATVTLSDGSTDVSITFDETVNTITVNGIVYSHGDSFILDGKKVTVVDF